jgi:hypothetical protein
LACSHCRKNPPFTWDAPKINRICNHIWIDTCCIDKSSSAELSEAINSMYDWYAASQVCYAYLENIERLDDTTDVNIKLLRNSTWFSRGWTLQELIAPKKVEFFDKDWKFLQNKQEGRSLLSQITTIPQDILLYPSPANMERYSVARKMTCKFTTVEVSLLELVCPHLEYRYHSRSNIYAIKFVYSCTTSLLA